MTFREKLMQEHPEYVGSKFVAGARGCPDSYGYEPRRICGLVDHDACCACWSREIPGTAPAPAPSPEPLSIDECLAKVRKLLSKPEILAQLAEESTELAKAALKMRRTLVPDNPTPVTSKEAYENILEELADVSNCLRALEYDGPQDLLRIQQIMVEKANRWPKRIEEARRNG